MDYTVEEIYLISGQYDKVVNITFKHDSVSRNLYGEHITGEFIYTPKERAELQKLIGADQIPTNDGYVKFNELLRNLSEEKRETLRRTGIKASDILSIIQRNTPGVNQFSNTQTRSLPKPIELKVDFSNTDEDAFVINSSKLMESSGHKLTPDELDELHAAMIRKANGTVPPEEFKKLFVDQVTGKIREGIRYQLLERKYYSKNGLTEEEDKEFKEILSGRISKRMDQAFRELEKSTEKVKDLSKKYPDVWAIIQALAINFREERLAYSRFPVWWDFERFLHIFLRHVSETQVGERFAEKTPFQYNLKEITELIKTVLDQLVKQIDEHFDTHPDKDFKRQGAMSVYYNGDYYSLHIAPDGRLMTFYKSSKNGQ